MIVLRQYQKDVLNDLIRSTRKGHKKIILQAATGSGKTIMAGALVQYALSKGKRVLFLAHRRELIIQARDKMEMMGVDAGIIMANISPNVFSNVQIASIQTLSSRWDKMDLPEADLVIIDEAHRSMSPTYIKLIRKYDKSLIVGLTATPVRADGTGLGAVYTDMVCAPGIKQLTAEGSLVTAKYYAPTVPDLRKIGTAMGDYVQSQLGEVMNTPKLVGNVIETWKALAMGTQTLVFGSGVAHSKALAEQFAEQGIRSAHLDGQTPNDERVKILDDFNNNRITVLCNCMVLTEGFDAPVARTVVLARPTKSLSLYIQMVGRVLRPHATKEYAIVIDHSGAVHTNGLATDDIDWKLGEGKIKENQRRERGEREEKEITCEGCFRIFCGSNICPSCGASTTLRSAYTDYIDGQLGLVNKVTKKVVRKERYGEGFKKKFYEELMGHSLVQKYHEDWSMHKFKERFGIYPKFDNVKPREPSKETKSYITHLQIKFARRRK